MERDTPTKGVSGDPGEDLGKGNPRRCQKPIVPAKRKVEKVGLGEAE